MKTEPHAARERPTRSAAPWPLPAAAALSLVGMLVHNQLELPQLTLLSPENAGPFLVTAALVALWWRGPRRAAAWALLGWGLLHLLVGAVLSVLPLPVWPFAPAQTLDHYAAHVVYGVAQVPLVGLAWREATGGPLFHGPPRGPGG